MANLPYTHLLHDNYYDFFMVSSLPRGRKRRKSYANSSSSPSNRAGWGWGCSWLGPSLFSVFANAWTGSGSRGQPLHMTIYTYLTCYAQCSQEFFPNSSPNSHLHQTVGSLSDSRSSSSSSLLFFSMFTFHSPLLLFFL
jgi:hypothetical protein